MSSPFSPTADSQVPLPSASSVMNPARTSQAGHEDHNQSLRRRQHPTIPPSQPTTMADSPRPSKATDVSPSVSMDSVLRYGVAVLYLEVLSKIGDFLTPLGNWLVELEVKVVSEIVDFLIRLSNWLPEFLPVWPSPVRRRHHRRMPPSQPITMADSPEPSEATGVGPSMSRGMDSGSEPPNRHVTFYDILVEVILEIDGFLTPLGNWLPEF